MKCSGGLSEFALPLAASGLAISFAAATLLAWSYAVPLASAAVAPGVIVVEGTRKTIQHADGGMIKEIRVRDGDPVAAGQVLLVLDDTRVATSLAALRQILAASLVEEARLKAERSDGQSLIDFFPSNAWINPADFPGVVAQQSELMRTRAASQFARLQSLDREASEARLQANQLLIQIEAHRERFRYTSRELSVAASLAGSGNGTQRRVSDVARALAEVKVDLSKAEGEYNAAVGRADGLRLERDRVVAARLQDLEDALDKNQRSRIEVVERLQVALSQESRLQIVAPVTGTVVNTTIHTIGGVVLPGMPILEVVPRDDRLVVAAQVRPSDIEGIHEDLPVEVRLQGLDGGLLPRISGRVIGVSADRLQERSRGNAYFEVRVAVDLFRNGTLGGFDVRPGMAADVMIMKGERTTLQYLAGALVGFVSDGYTR